MSHSPKQRFTCHVTMAPLVLGLLLLTPMATMAASGAAEGTDAKVSAAKQEFLDQGCDKCHSIAAVEIEAKVKSEKMKGPDLDGVGTTHDAEWMTQYVLGKVELNDKDHKGKWEGTNKQLEVITAWLATLKKE